MKINFAQVLVGLEGEPLKMGEPAEDVTLRKVATTSLLAAFDDERQLDAQKKFERYLLATTIQKAKSPITLKTEDVSLLKKLVGKAFGAVVVGAAWPLLDSAEKVTDRAVAEAE